MKKGCLLVLSFLMLSSCSFNFSSPSIIDESVSENESISDIDSVSEDISITSEPSISEEILVREIRLDVTSKTIKRNETLKIKYTVLPSDAKNKTIRYSVSDENVISVISETANSITIRALRSGNSTITFKNEKSGVTNKCDITVKQDSTSLDGGWTMTTGNKGLDPTTYVCNSLTDFSTAISLSAINHYDKCKCKFDFDNRVSFYDLQTYYCVFELHVEMIDYENYQTGTGKVNTFVLRYENDNKLASNFMERQSSLSYKEVVNANFEIRLNKFKSSKRSEDFEDFPIYLKNNGTLPIHNSEELFFALESGYLPTFPESGTKAEYFYNEALNICRNYITDDMSDMEKFQTLFDYIVYNTNYDYEALDDESSHWWYNTCYYLEGAFEHDTCVCDGYSKLYSLLCGIEGLPVHRAYGYDTGDGGGHAWNHVYVDNEWYLVCPTWGQADIARGMIDKIFTNITYVSYDACFANDEYFDDASGNSYHFDSRIYPEVHENKTNRLDISLETFEKGKADDYHIEDLDEVANLAKAIKNANITSTFTVTLTYSKNVTSVSSRLKKELEKLDYSISQIYEIDADSNGAEYVNILVKI